MASQGQPAQGQPAGGQPAQDPAGGVRAAQPADVPALARMLVRAYMDDPIAVWICKSSPLRAKLLEALYTERLRQMLPHRGVWTNAERSSAAVWTPPQYHQSSIRPSAALLRCLLHPQLAARLPLLAAGFTSMQRAHPRSPPHWYLSLLATDPDARGRGLGSAALQPVLERCDSDGVAAYLESSKARNLGFYARLGFRVTGELRLPGGPRIWPMWREANEDRA
jgi:ribosomal protein S18 acetylase RimI-like enzyme